MSDRSRQLLRNQNLDTVEPTAFKQVGGAIFPDRAGAYDITQFVSIVDAFKQVHAPNYGNTIQGTGAVVTHDPTIAGAAYEDVLTPSTNEIYKITAFQVENAAVSPAVFRAGVNSDSTNVGFFRGTVDPSGVLYIPINECPLLLSNQKLVFNLESGTPADITVTVAYAKVSQ